MFSRLIDRLDEIIGMWPQSCQLWDVSSLSLLVPFLCASISVYQKNTVIQKVDQRRPVHTFVSFLFLFCFPGSLLWFCHSEVHLSEEKPAALIGGCGWVCLLWCWWTRLYLRLNQTVYPQQLLALSGEIPPPHTPPAWFVWDSAPRRDGRTSTVRMWQFSPLGDSRAK